jgi:ATP phosphoribosyltransferase
MKLKIAIQKKGYTTDEVLLLLKKAGFRFSISDRKLVIPCKNFPMEILLVRNSDIPSYIEQGVADIGFIGQNLINEKNCQLEVLKTTPLANCRLSVIVPEKSEIQSINDLKGKTIATSYMNSTQKFFKEKEIDVNLVYLQGSVEIAPQMGMADAISDLVSTGSTIRAQRLREIDVVFNSNLVLIGKRNSELLDEFLFRISTILNAYNKKLYVFDAPKANIDEIVRMIPSAESPTISPLSNSDWVACSTVIDDDQFWDITQKIKALGAKAIFTQDIEKLVL